MIDDLGFNYLSDITDLKQLNMAWCVNLSQDAFSDTLRYFTGLTSLDISWANVTNSGFEYLSHLTNLEHLFLKHCCAIGDLGLAKLSGLGFLKELVIDECERVSNVGVKVVSCLTHLERLSMSQCWKIGNSTVYMICCSIGNSIRELDCSGCLGLNDETIDIFEFYMMNLVKLKKLKMNGCYKIMLGKNEVKSRLSSIQDIELGVDRV